MLSLLLAIAMAAQSPTPAPPPVWRDGLDWHGEHVGMQARPSGGYTLSWAYGQRHIPAAPLRVDTASMLFDGLFAMAQDDLQRDSVDAIHDGAYDHGNAIACHCFVTGLKWPYVWTRDLSYATDLGLWRFDPTRVRNGLLFKLSTVRKASAPQGLYPMQDTGSGGSWPISSDRVVWFLAARHLLGNAAFANKVYMALRDTLAQDRQYVFDARMGLYRGETSFLDWREQSYPAWTANEVVPIAQSFALSTNVLHYQALRLAARMASKRRDKTAAATYATHADALKKAVNRHFWRADRGMYMSYIGGDGTPYDTYDLLGISLAITSGVAGGERARQTLANYPVWPAGSPVIWPERPDQPIYHNRSIWPFVSMYALRAARVTDNPARIAHVVRSLMCGAALTGSNMENYSLLTQEVHVDRGKLSGPVVDSPRQLWSVAAYLDLVAQGVFGLTDAGKVEPKLPVSLVPMLFGKRRAITLALRHRRIVLQLPASFAADKGGANLLIADHTTSHGDKTTVTLKAIHVDAPALRTDAPMHAPAVPPAPMVKAAGDAWQVHVSDEQRLYIDGQAARKIDGDARLARHADFACFSTTRVGAHGLESLHSPQICAGKVDSIGGDWPRAWTAPSSGTYRVWLDYANDHGPINTGITAAVKMLAIECPGQPTQRVPLAMPHSLGRQASTWATFTVAADAHCRFQLGDGFNMSYLAHFSHYTGGEGGASGPLNQADVGDLHVAAWPTDGSHR
ncbi:MAG TPA: Six-hairpin glycosidase-like protein [Rhodanobacteraceae bacterium]|nr:Six-hairpin glycosidase-like protein [Rhodanobacteraceae bacterium]